MKLLQPHWVHHDDKPIFSVDIHQDCMKFATGGQGNDSGRVVIWNLLPVLSEKAEEDETIPKILCQMDNHLACVNCVRWSQNGQMLASGSDDKLVMIWKKSKGPSGVFGSGGITKNQESWKCFSTLRGHAGDVLDLAWSPQDRWLASGSVDNSIIIWDIQALPTMVAVLKGHTGLVKGVTWDPVGKFLASQSDDRSVKIWKTSDWKCSNTITEPFEECGGTTHILRISWSPDGQYLVSAHAMNGGGPTAQIIEREGWKCDKDFVGHRKAVTCVRFHNSILKRQTPKSNKQQQYCCLAVGSRDRSLSVWMTALQRPLVVIHDLFQDSVLDLSWGPEKCVLLACSSDGTVACLQFSEQELGTALNEEDKNSLYQRIYGKSATVDTGSSGRDMIIENAELLGTIHKRLEAPKLPTTCMAPPLVTPNEFAKTNGSSTSASQKVDPMTTSPVKPICKQIETRTVDGKRRITPVFIPVNQDAGDISNTPQLNSSSRASVTAATSILVDTVSTSHQSTVITAAEQVHLDNRLTKTASQTAPARSSAILKSFPTNTTAISKDPKTSNGPARINITATSKGECTKSFNEFRVNVQNGNLTTSYGSLCKVTGWSISSSERLWEIFIGSPVVNFCLCSKYVLLCSLDGTLRFLNIAHGTGVLPVLSLATSAIQCAFCPLGQLAGVVSECGQLRIWKIDTQQIFIKSSCSDIFSKSGQVVQFSITESGVPFIMFSNGNSYSYSASMQCWMVLNSKDPVLKYGIQTSIPKDFQKNIRTYPLMTVQSITNNHAASGSSGGIDLNSSKWQPSAKLGFIENQIKLCEAINSPEELKYWYSTLVFNLANSGTEKKLRIVLDDLLGHSHWDSNSDKILNIDKRSILITVLDILKLQPKWQRIYMEYTEQLNFFVTKQKDEKMFE